jgi:multidrug efflux pump subunit AcrB
MARRDLLGSFAHNTVIANMLMVIMLAAGVAALGKLNRQLFPSFAIDYINVSVAWRGATAEDVEEAITTPIESELKDLDHVRKVTSISSQGYASIFIEYEVGSDLGAAQNQVNEAVGQVRNLPASAEKPQIRILENRELIARVLVTGPSSRNELRGLTKQMERDLLQQGVSRVQITGLPAEEVAIQIPGQRLVDLGLSMDQLAAQLAARSVDLPAGEVGGGESGRQLRSLEQRREVIGFEDLNVVSRDGGHIMRLGDIAQIERRPRENEVEMRYRGKPAVELALFRGESEDSLRAAEILEKWLGKTRANLPSDVNIVVFNEQWILIKERINLLLVNGLSGLVCVVLILYLFLNGRVSFWIAWGIPTAFMATLAVLWVLGGSINMVTLFAMIMALGIIVDDAIVVGEDALTHYEMGEPPLTAAEGGARRMVIPVLGSSMTTVAAFLPLMMIGGVIGEIMFSIPLVIICVLIASLTECFLILPAHLRSTFAGMHHGQPTRMRRWLDQRFDDFRELRFRPLASWAVKHRLSTLAIAIAALMVAIGLLKSGRLPFVFFPTPENPVIIANLTFVAGTPIERIDGFLAELEKDLYQTEVELPGDLIVTAITERGRNYVDDGQFTRTGDRYAMLRLELVAADHREVRNEQFMEHWKKLIELPAGVENFEMYSPTGGPPGRDIEVRLRGDDINVLKAAAEDLAAFLRSSKGVYAISDDTPYGREQIIYKLTPQGEGLGLTVSDIGNQLRAAYDGRLVQIFQDLGDEVEVRIMLPETQRSTLASLDSLPIVLANGSTVPLSSVVELSANRGFETLRHRSGKLAVKVSADVDETENNPTLINAELAESVLPELIERYGIDYQFEGRAEDQSETLGDMMLGVWLGLMLIYIVLGAVFGSYGWPLVVMCMIPFGLTGAIFGHWAMGLDLTIVSLFGLFAVSGIVVNDAIVLVNFYKELRAKGMAVEPALIEASVLRLRAVLLTSLTTIAGLTPLLFETSLQAQFLIPMAVSLCFGLGFATFLVLLLVPALLGIYELWGTRTEPATAAPVESPGSG